jgi:hypothetical protein
MESVNKRDQENNHQKESVLSKCDRTYSLSTCHFSNNNAQEEEYEYVIFSTVVIGCGVSILTKTPSCPWVSCYSTSGMHCSFCACGFLARQQDLIMVDEKSNKHTGMKSFVLSRERPGQSGSSYKLRIIELLLFLTSTHSTASYRRLVPAGQWVVVINLLFWYYTMMVFVPINASLFFLSLENE